MRQLGLVVSRGWPVAGVVLGMTGSHAIKSDGALLRAVARDVGAFDEFYRRYEAIVAAYLQKRTRDPELTADLAGETFAAALRNAGQFVDDGGSAAGWVLGIARHRMLRYWERQGAEGRAMQRVGLGLRFQPLSGESIERIEQLVDAKAVSGPLFEALGALPPAQREAVRAHVLDEHSYGDIAEVQGVASATVRQRVSRGLSRMRTAIGEEPS